MSGRRRVTNSDRHPRRMFWALTVLSALALVPLLLLQTGVLSTRTVGRAVPTAPFSDNSRVVWKLRPAAADKGQELLKKEGSVLEQQAEFERHLADEAQKLSALDTDAGTRPVALVLGQAPPPLEHLSGTVTTGQLFVVATKHGNITIKFRGDKAPQHVEYMRTLIARKQYDGKCFYRSEKKFVLQGGLRNAAGRVETSGLPSPPLEYSLPNRRGFVNMARWEDPNSGGGDFCVLLKDSPHLDQTGTKGYAAGFTVWAEVVQGMDVADRISEGPTKQVGGLNFLRDAVSFESVTIV